MPSRAKLFRSARDLCLGFIFQQGTKTKQTAKTKAMKNSLNMQGWYAGEVPKKPELRPKFNSNPAAGPENCCPAAYSL